MIEVAGVKKAFGTTKALCGVDLMADRAKVLGPSGSTA
jgi:ABC-type Fe3+/spermidine/putrescine transport system ATPase subunit